MTPNVDTMMQKLVKAGLSPLRSQAEMSEKILEHRLNTVLPAAMKNSGIDLWIVIGGEYNEDPIMKTLFTWDNVYARRITALMFWLPPEEKEVRRMTVGTRSPALDRLYEAPAQAEETVWDTIARVVTQCNPGAIGVNRSTLFNHCDGLSASMERQLIACLPEEYRSRVTNAEALGIAWLQQTTAPERELMSVIVDVTHDIISEGYFSGYIVPGVTTTEDIEWHMRETIHALGLRHWFGPDIDLQRRSGGGITAAENTRLSGIAVQPGDLLHCDIGFFCPLIPLHTDIQQLAYIPMPGEKCVPQGLSGLMEQGNRFQDIVMAEMTVGRSGNDVFEASVKAAAQSGIQPMLYTHPLGTFGHGAGPGIGQYDKQWAAPGRGEYPVPRSSCYALELNIHAPLPEWDNQDVYIYLEEDIVIIDDKPHFLSGRQREIGLVP